MAVAVERRDFLGLAGGALAGAWAAGVPSLAFAQGSGDASFSALLDKLFAQSLLLEPERATALGLDTGARAVLRSRLDGSSRASHQATLAFYRDARAAVSAVDPASLSQANRRNRAIVLHRFDEELAGAKFDVDNPQTPFVIDQQRGAYFGVPDFLDSQHPIETTADAEAYLARLARFPVVLDDQTAEFVRQAGMGRIPPVWAIDLALGQMGKLRGVSAGSTGMVTSLVQRAAAKGLAGNWQARATAIVSGKVFPALDRQMAALRRLRAKSPAGDGIWRLKDGAAIYAAALAAATTTKLTPEQVHQMGLDQVAEISAQLDDVLKAAGHTGGTLGERLSALNRAPDQLYADTAEGRQQLIASLNRGVEKMRLALPKAFADIPNDPLSIRAVPTDIQDGAPNGYYNSAPLDKSRPAIYWINLKSVNDWPKYTLPSLTYHEGIPGHHLQGGYAAGGGELPMILRDYFISSYGEGWALYAEQLADELGGYEGIERAGYLQSFLFRAVRLVVDTGIHHYRWSREKATAYMVEKTGFTQARSQREIERYCTMIGQACSYKIGHTAWVANRRKAEKALGDKFSLAWFHAVLKEGAMPLSMLEARIDERIAERLRAG